MNNYKLVIAYDGTRYNGWQRQGNTENTIQGKLNEIIGKYLGEEVDVIGSGRTDKGVHAKMQVVSFKTKKSIDIEEFVTDINRYLPQDICIMEASPADGRFHARLNAVSKTYEYIIDNGEVPDIFFRKYSYRVEEHLDTDAMRKAAELLIGTHDFKSFCGNKHLKKSSVRTITDIRLIETTGKVYIYFEGDGFLQNMVRIMTGTLIEVGTGKRDYKSITDILEAKDREKAGFMAPPEGLSLTKVEY
ncbi:MAG: tRNA pseudouridine(38-40) synthase TruA [Lachnospiraceae bacterium]|nr:tRNA pseudouridine(38-40) synthase TruA [Lachnospiraceae bacterium]